MQWFALLGREKAIVRAELASQLNIDSIEFSDSIAIGHDQPPDWNTFGGVIRAGQIITSAQSKNTLADATLAALTKPPATGKVSIGLSSLDLKPHELRSFGKLLKTKYILAYNKRPRIVFPPTGTLLNAGHLHGNRLLNEPNCEIFLIKTTKTWLVGKTNWQQNIDSYTMRDRQRPARDAKVGMLPPKLAQSMLNLANVSAGDHVHDPFCGTGVILTEALLKNAIISGSDAASDMVQASQENTAWMCRYLDQESCDFEIFQADAQTVNMPDQTTHIVSEGYLGNPDLRNANEQRLHEEAHRLMPLYHNFFNNLAQFPHPLTVVFALPVWFSSHSTQPIHLPILDDLPDMGYTVEKFAPSSTRALIYRRSHQTVGRAIIKLRKG